MPPRFTAALTFSAVTAAGAGGAGCGAGVAGLTTIVTVPALRQLALPSPLPRRTHAVIV